MTGLFLIAKTDACGGLLPIVRLIRQGVFPVVQIFIPIILIIWGTIDLGKAVVASDDKAIKAAQSMLIKRAIYAAAIFFVVMLVRFLMNTVATAATDDANTDGWDDCWKAAGKKKK